MRARSAASSESPFWSVPAGEISASRCVAETRSTRVSRIWSSSWESADSSFPSALASNIRGFRPWEISSLAACSFWEV